MLNLNDQVTYNNRMQIFGDIYKELFGVLVLQTDIRYIHLSFSISMPLSRTLNLSFDHCVAFFSVLQR